VRPPPLIKKYFCYLKKHFIFLEKIFAVGFIILTASENWFSLAMNFKTHFMFLERFSLPVLLPRLPLKVDFHWRFFSPTTSEKWFPPAVHSYLSVQIIFFYWLLALTVLKNLSTNVFTTACIELLCKKRMSRLLFCVASVWTSPFIEGSPQPSRFDMLKSSNCPLKSIYVKTHRVHTVHVHYFRLMW
jgi:hypothetical protein